MLAYVRLPMKDAARYVVCMVDGGIESSGQYHFYITIKNQGTARRALVGFNAVMLTDNSKQN